MNNFFEKYGEQIKFADHPGGYYLEKGMVALVSHCTPEVYYAETDLEGNPIGGRNYLFQAESGQWIFDLGQKNEDKLHKLFLREQDGELFILPKSKLPQINSEVSDSAQWLNAINTWCELIGEAIGKSAPPRKFVSLKAGEEVELVIKSNAYPIKGVAWLQTQSGEFNLLGEGSYSLKELKLFPVTAHTWIYTQEDLSKAKILTNKDVVEHPEFFESLEAYHNLLATILVQRKEAEAIGQKKKLIERTGKDQKNLEGALSNLRQSMERKWEEDAFSDSVDDHYLMDVMRHLGKALKVKIVEPADFENQVKKGDPLEAIMQSSKLRRREVILRGNWWQENNGHLLAYDEAGKVPKALIQVNTNKYIIRDPVFGTSEEVTEEIASSLHPVAYMIFEPFDRQINNLKDLWDIARRGLERDASYFLVAGFAGGLLGLITPILSGVIMDDVIPQADRRYLLEIVGILILVSVLSSFLSLFSNILVLRLESKSTINLQAGLMDHLLRLPVTFFKEFSAGDLTNRVLSINQIRRILSRTVFSAIMGGVFSSVNIILLFYYDPKLAWIALFLVAFAMVTVIGIAWIKLSYTRQLAEVRGKITGMLFEFVSGINKIRVAGAEKRVFSEWARHYAKQRALSFKAGIQSNYMSTFNKAFPMVTYMFFFFFIYYGFQEAADSGRTYSGISVGIFLAFISAFRQFMGKSLGMSLTLLNSLDVIPLYERMKPLLQAEPESSAGSDDPGELQGNIELKHINFRYEEDGPLILEDINIEINSGEMVALVGPSGSGKSTILRLLLGFEKPEAGSLYFDQHDMASLSIEAVRRQIGVVLQHGSLLPGDIFTNIIGNSNLTLKDAWEAAELCGLADDINDMPMKMHTIISQGGATFSGGQLQRLMIARAIVHKPRFLFFDEATSALDNRTQAIVTESLNKLQATRIIIAHRLSTIKGADKIYVLRDGKLVESGNYESLMALDGEFTELARRQIT